MTLPRIVVTGTTGYLGAHVARALDRHGGFDVVPFGRGDADLAAPDAFARAVAAAAPDIVVNCAAASTVAACEADPRLAQRVNADAVAALAAATRARLVQVSTDLVFDGRDAPYLASATPRPLSVYGRSKRAGEVAALTAADALVVRLPLLFGPSADGRRGATDPLRAGTPLGLYTNEFRTPLHVREAGHIVAGLAIGQGRGIMHVAGPERVSRWELAQRFARIHGLDPSRWWPAVATAPDRPRDVALLSGGGHARSLDAALADA